MNRQNPDQMNPLRTNPVRTWGYPCSYFPYFSTYSTSCIVSSFKWPCGALPNFMDFRYRSGYRGVSLRASLRGPENVWSQVYVSSDTKFWQAPCCNSTPGQWLWRSVRDRTRMLFQHISARSLSESTSSPSPSSSASSPSSSSWCVMN